MSKTQGDGGDRKEEQSVRAEGDAVTREERGKREARKESKGGGREK